MSQLKTNTEENPNIVLSARQEQFLKEELQRKHDVIEIYKKRVEEQKARISGDYSKIEGRQSVPSPGPFSQGPQIVQ